MSSEKKSFPPKSPNSKLIKLLGIPAFILLVLFIGFSLTVATTGMTVIHPGQIGVIINNLNGQISLQTVPGRVFHMPLGITQVHRFDAKLQTLTMSATTRSDVLGTSVVKLKSRDGSDVFLDITITYTIDPAKGEVVAREIGVNRSTPNPQILISYARSLVRDEFGKLSIEEVIDASTRNEAVLKLRDLMAKDLEPFGIVINTIAVQNPNFNPQFEELIKQRKSADQELTNQASAQDSAQSDQERQVSEAQRVKETTIREDEGKQRRRIIEAEAAAEERKRLAEGEAYRIRVDGERSKEVAEQTAQAVLTEGLKRAEGVQKMAEAYQANGLGQVRAALAEKFIGTRIMGRPYSLSSTVDRLRVEENEAGNEGIDDEARKQAAAATMTQ